MKDSKERKYYNKLGTAQETKIKEQTKGTKDRKGYRAKLMAHKAPPKAMNPASNHRKLAKA